MTRSRRAGLSRDEARQQPLYARMLGLQYLAPGGFLCFVFLEGAVALGILLALAELVSWWGVLVLPAMVAAMVKLNDVVAGSLIHPAGARTMPGATVRADPRGSPHADPRGSARAGSPGSLRSAHAGSPGSARAGAPGSLGSARAGSPGSLGSGHVDPSGAGRIGSSGSARDDSLGPGRAGASGASGASGAETVRLSAEAIAQVNALPPAGGAAPALRPAALRHVTADAGPGARDDERWPPPPAMDASALNGPPVTRQWTEDLDDSRQRARQSAARRYE